MKFLRCQVAPRCPSIHGKLFPTSNLQFWLFECWIYKCTACKRAVANGGCLALTLMCGSYSAEWTTTFGATPRFLDVLALQ